jgi:YcaO-like protein with predicted kinase domain
LASKPSDLNVRNLPEPLVAIAREIGITRIGDITGLDIAGIPVVQAVRPLSFSNAVSQGKGATLENAVISAVLESAEAFFAERLDRCHVVRASAEGLSIERELFAKHLLERGRSSTWCQMTLEWTEALNLLDGRKHYIPIELVHTSYVHPVPVTEGIFATSTTGLAAGFTKEHALLHGILECVERDSLARANKMHGFLHRQRIDLTTIQDTDILSLISGLRDKGLMLALWRVPSISGVPVIWCHLLERARPENALLPLPAEGSAARATAKEAARQAIFEAAQSRLTAISGARDDFTRAYMVNSRELSRIAAHQKFIAEGPAEIEFSTIADVQGPDYMKEILSSLERVGCSAVFALQFDTSPLGNVSVSKVVVPDLLPLLDG